jgi:hypothetical protein
MFNTAAALVLNEAQKQQLEALARADQSSAGNAFCREDMACTCRIPLLRMGCLKFHQVVENRLK